MYVYIYTHTYVYPHKSLLIILPVYIKKLIAYYIYFLLSTGDVSLKRTYSCICLRVRSFGSLDKIADVELIQIASMLVLVLLEKEDCLFVVIYPQKFIFVLPQCP